MNALGLDRRAASLEARIMLAFAAGQNQSWVMAHERDVLAPGEQSGYQVMLERRLAGEPIAYIMGKREFFGRTFHVTPDVLIPRPETELLVELALEKCKSLNSLEFLDLGTGSGCVAITLSLRCPVARVTAVEASFQALELAKKNANTLGANVEFLQGHWLDPVVERRFDIIVANPPYVSPQDPHLHLGDVRFEPIKALIAQEEGLAEIKTIVNQAKCHLKSGGCLMLEHGYDQSVKVRALMNDAGYVQIETWRDLGGIERVTAGKMSE